MTSRREERGAVAMLVALFAVIVMIIAAMVVDFGQAYVNKRQAQTAADAGALAAANIFKEQSGTCATLVGNNLLQAKAKAAAEAIMGSNLPGSRAVYPAGLKIGSCDGNILKVRMQVSYDSPVSIGQIVPGQSGNLTVDRSATAALGRAQLTVGNLRPWMICGAQIPAGPFPTQVTPVGLPGNGHLPSDPKCVNPNKPGDWWRTTCFNGGGSHGDTVNNILVGCEEITIVPGQNAAADKFARSTYLRSKCGPESTYCLGDDTGRDVKTMAPAWATLLGKTFAMPVFCSDGDCSPTSVTKTGNWPVWKIAAVTICGYAMKGAWSSNTLPAGECRTMNGSSLTPVSAFPDNADIGFLLIFRGIIDSGSTTTVIEGTETSVRLVE